MVSETEMALWADGRVRGTRKLVALAIAQFAADDGWTKAKQTVIARRATCCIRVFRESVNELERLGLVEVRRGGAGAGDRSSYRLTLEG